MILIVEDPAIATAVESHIDTLLAQSPRVDREDPEWRKPSPIHCAPVSPTRIKAEG